MNFDAITAAVLLRKGRRQGDEVIFQCVYPDRHQHGDRTPSASWNSSKQAWTCYGCHAGGTAKELAELLGLDIGGNGNGHHSGPPAGVPKTYRGATLVAWWVYRDAQSRELGVVARYEKDGKKEVIPFFKKHGATFSIGAPDVPAPLFGLDILAAQPNATVWIVEGEKCAQAIHRLAGVAVTSQGGSSAAAKADWSVLAGRDVVLWPDNDEPGQKYARDVRELCSTVNVKSFRVVDISGLGLGAGGDVADWLAANPGAGLLKLSELVGDAPQPSGLILYSVEELLRMKFPPRQYIISPWLRSKDLVMLYAWRGAGKTWVTLSLALSLCSASPFLKWKVDRPSSVLLVDGEMPQEALQSRCNRLVLSSQFNEPTARFDIIAADWQERSIPSLATPEGQQLIESRLNHDVLIIDNISTLCGTSSSENEAESWLPVQDWALHLRKKGVAVWFIHHAGKGGQQRGTSKREDVLDFVVKLGRPADYQDTDGARFEWHFEKARGVEGKHIEPFEARLDDGQDGGAIWTMRTIQDVMDSRIIDLFSDGLSLAEIAKEVGLHKSNVSRRVKVLRETGVIA